MEEETKTTASSVQPVSEPSGKGAPIVPVLIAFLLLCAGLVFLMIKVSSQTAGMIRDIALVLLVLESVITLVCFVVLIVRIGELISLLKRDIRPILKTTEETARNVKGTVTFIGNKMIEPTIRVTSTVSGIKRAASVVTSLFKH